MVKNVCVRIGDGTLKLLYLNNESIIWANFLQADTNLGKLKVTSVIVG